MKAKRGGRSRYFVQSERTVIDNPNDASHMGNTLYMARIKTKSGCQSPALFFITGEGGGMEKFYFELFSFFKNGLCLCFSHLLAFIENTAPHVKLKPLPFK